MAHKDNYKLFCSINYLNKSKKIISIDKKHIKDITLHLSYRSEIME